jgi:uncharacterized membrane protein SirB2
MLDQFCNWLEATPVSHALQSAEWLIPSVQTLHILSIGLVMSAVVMFDLRLLQVSFTDQPVMRVAARFLPVVWRTLPVLLLTGMILIVAEPARSLQNGAFQLKMLLLVAVVALTRAVQGRINTNRWNSVGAWARTAFPFVSLLLWVGIVFAGRWIAYVRVQ